MSVTHEQGDCPGCGGKGTVLDRVHQDLFLTCEVCNGGSVNYFYQWLMFMGEVGREGEDLWLEMARGNIDFDYTVGDINPAEHLPRDFARNLGKHLFILHARLMDLEKDRQGTKVNIVRTAQKHLAEETLKYRHSSGPEAACQFLERLIADIKEKEEIEALEPPPEYDDEGNPLS